MPDTRTLTHVDTLRLPVTKPFNFRYTFWKPSHFATGLERHSRERSWRTFRVGELVCGVVLTMDGSDTVRAEVYSDGSWREADRDRLSARVTHSYGLDEDISAFVSLAERVPSMREPLTALAGMRQSCPENLFEIAITSLVLQNATVARSTQMMTNLLDHYGLVAEFDGVTLKVFCTPEEIAGIDEATFRERDRLGYRAKYIGRFAEFFTAHDPDAVDHASKAELMTEFQTIKGVGPYTAAIIASHAVRDPSALGLDVWNRKLLAQRFLGVDDAAAEIVLAEMRRLFPGYEGLAGLYVIENAYREQAVVELVH
ncbi:MAG: DNA-3-methyladenine glycosylase family protein [Sciscionella sp.]